MVNKISLSTYVEYIMEEFGIPKNKANFVKVRKKFQRELDKKGLWEKAETKLDGRTKTKIFSENDLFYARLSIRDYLLKNGNIDKAKYYAYLDSIDDYLESRFEEPKEESREEKENREKYNRVKATHQEILDLKIDAIFKIFYDDIDIEQWNSDKIYVDEIDDMDAQCIECFNARERLANPLKYYCKRKKED